ncbi:MAG: aminoacyl-tRNA hydrolase [Bacilli bacterium]|nr:aminoacyl-tRNA hydrolase [Bacilli bacterium]
MKLIVGLGNPGSKYEHTRHNMGFDTLDLLNETLKIKLDKNKFQGLYGKGGDIILFKPETFMNLSGIAVREIMTFYKIDINDLLVISDDMALPVGKIRLRDSGSSGGHKGLQNIIDNLGTDKFKRVRIGIGEPKFNTIDFVLSKPSKEEAPLIDTSQKKAKDAILEYLKTDFTRAMSKFN